LSKKKKKWSSTQGVDSDSKDLETQKTWQEQEEELEQGLDSNLDDDLLMLHNKKNKKNNSKRGFDLDSNSDESSLKSKTDKKKKKQQYSNDEKLATRHKKKQPTVQESVQQSRTILKSVKKSKEGGVLVEVQEVMNQVMTVLIAQPKAQREKMMIARSQTRRWNKV
jgi:hypothetical protein